jgi:transposase
MATASITIDLDLPDGVEGLEYERHGDGHTFHVAWPLPQVDPARVVRSVGMDEISLKKRHKLYATILTDLSDPARPEVLAVAPGRGRDAAVTCLNQLSPAQREAVASHRKDMSPAYLSACQELLPNSQSVIDRFHVAKQLGEVADALRKK